jgi:hypothetical protein
MLKSLIALAVLMLAPLASAPVEVSASEPKKERKICRRDHATESRLGSRRICKTEAQWRAEGNKEAGYDRLNNATRNGRF